VAVKKLNIKFSWTEPQYGIFDFDKDLLSATAALLVTFPSEGKSDRKICKGTLGT